MPYPIEDFVKSYNIATATLATNKVALIAPFELSVISIEVRFRVGSTSGVLDVVKSADGTSVAAGTSILASTIDLSTAKTADTKQIASILTTINGKRIPKGSTIGFLFSGTLTGLLDLDITIVYRQHKKA